MPDDVQKPDVNARAVAWAGAAIVAAIVVAALAAWLAWQTWNPSRAHDGPNTAFDFTVEPPQLQSAPQKERAAYMAQKEALLHAWQWIDKERGIARIPIEQAMELAVRNSQADANALARPPAKKEGR